MVSRVDYEVTGSIGKAEIRKYPELLLATVYGKDDSVAFNILFDYISGANRLKRKIEMTAPVVSIRRTEDTGPGVPSGNLFTFVMPSAYGLDTIPEPDNAEVKLHVQKEKTFAVLRFGGRTTEERVDLKKKELLEIVSFNNISKRGDVFLMRYNSPFMPGFLRTNEVGIEVIL